MRAIRAQTARRQVWTVVQFARQRQNALARSHRWTGWLLLLSTRETVAIETPAARRELTNRYWHQISNQCERLWKTFTLRHLV